MNTDRDSLSFPTPREDLFDAWLDAMVTGMSTPETDALTSNSSRRPLDRVTSAATQFHGLVQAADASNPEPSRSSALEDFMQAPFPVPSRTIPRPAFTRPSSRSRPVATVQAWASYALLAVVVAGLTLCIGRATNFFETSSPPPVDEQIIPFSGYVNGEGTPVPMGESSSIPYPNGANCTINPLTRDEVVLHIQAASTATEQTYPAYEQAIVPSDEDSQAIMDTFRMWQACQLNGRAYAYSMSLETVWFTSTSSPFFYSPGWNQPGETIDERIERFADIAILDEDELDLLYPPSTPTQQELDAYATEGAIEAATYQARVVPLPEGATPIAFPTGGGFMPTIFPSDIQIGGPDVAFVTAVLVKQDTGEISTGGNISMRFVRIDGVWLIDRYEFSGDANRG